MNIQSLRNISQAVFLFFVATTVALDGMLHTQYGPIIIAAAPASFGLVLLIFALGEKFPRFNTLHTFFFFYLFWSSLSYIWTTTPADTAWRLFLLNFYFMIMVIIYWYSIDSKEKLNQAYFAVFIAIFFLARVVDYNFGMGIQEGGGESGRYTAYDIGANEMAITLGFGMTFALYLSSLYKKIWLRLLILGTIPIFISSSFLTGSRMGFVILLIGLIYAVLQISRMQIFEKIVVSLVFIAAIASVIRNIPSDLKQRVFSTWHNASTGNFNEREVIWQIGFDGFKDQPLIGRGVDSFTRMSNNAHMDLEAHNTYISILVEYGMIGFFIYLLLIGGLFFFIMRLKGADKYFPLILMVQLLFAQLTTNLQDNTILWSFYALMISHCWIMSKSDK
jgi:O-antigen ligase